MNKKKIIIIIIIALLIFIWLNNTSLFVKKDDSKPLLLAHRGLGQTFDIDGVEWNTDTSKIILEPEHPYIENTLESIEVAFEYGADIVEFDIRVTKDKKLAVFHDFELSYRTNGKGLVSEYTMDELKELDIGYGYTADGGKTYPFRGKFIGMMPSINEIFERFPDKEFLIHFKDQGIESAILLNDFLKKMPSSQVNKISVYGDVEATIYIKKRYPKMKTFNKPGIKNSLIKYELFGWTGYIPESMKYSEIHLPIKYSKFVWGWPDKFSDRLEKSNSRLVIVNGDGKWSTGFNSEEDLKMLPDSFNGTIWTDRIDILGPIFKESK